MRCRWIRFGILSNGPLVRSDRDYMSDLDVTSWRSWVEGLRGLEGRLERVVVVLMVYSLYPSYVGRRIGLAP
jgi:hypothetical protein